MAAWYLKYRTYVDDAVAGSDTQEGMVELSGDLETLAGTLLEKKIKFK